MDMGSMSSTSSSSASSSTSTSSSMDMSGMDMSGMDMSSMNTYFTDSYLDYPILFKTLKAKDEGAAFGIFCILFFAAFALRGLNFLIIYLEQKVWKTSSTDINITIEEEENCACDAEEDIGSDEKHSRDESEKHGDQPVVSTTAPNGHVTLNATTTNNKATVKNAHITNNVNRRQSNRSPLAQLFAPSWGEIYKDIIRLVLHFLSAMFSFALMLATMSFILVYFFAICLGVAFGEVFFNRLRIVLEMDDNMGGILCSDLHS
ncbi:high-affinity Cu transporter [Saccharomycopsis crataegensis]|uniref:Copper transport protein n=1 Tax=Saccharomycopsis crataegensis TaxID=43959 RepID=A0AAV5QI15_9ASCO|nr:high-affinity Cu transporter [Saccharomycopsis crataegensis]